MGDAERHWFQDVVAGTDVELPWDEGRSLYDPQAPFVCDRSAAEILAYYREQCERADAVLVHAPMSAAPRGRHDDSHEDEIASVRSVVLHIIEETAAHSGHLEVARELLGGRTNLGLR